MPDHSQDYLNTARDLSGYAKATDLAFCGLLACVDAIIDLRFAAPLIDHSAPAPAKRLAAELKARVARGVGGEFKFDWPGGSRWLETHLRPRLALGGTGAHAARIYSMLGLRALLALTDRSEGQLAQIDRPILLANGNSMVPVGDLTPGGPGRPYIYIFEYTAGCAAGGVIPQRSSRIIVRFGDPGLDMDRAFEALSVACAAQARSAILSGFNAVAIDSIDDALKWASGLARKWQDAGVPLIHLELAGYRSAPARDTAMEALSGVYNSIGMSYSEFNAFDP